MISYCIACYRPTYTRLLVDDLARKTSTPYELLLWLNVEDASLDCHLARMADSGIPVRIVGRTPHNVGMTAYRKLFAVAGYPLITQLDDDVVCVSRGMAERAQRLFDAFPNVKQIVADVWQDTFTTGARPPLDAYRPISVEEGLYDGPVDGWCSIYHHSIKGLLLEQPYAKYFCLGAAVRQALRRRRLHGLLCTAMKVFHVIGPEYASLFGMREFEIEKYRTLGRMDIVEWYGMPSPDATVARLEANWAAITETLNTDGPWVAS